MEHPTYWIDPTGTVIPQELKEYFDFIEAKTGRKLNEGQRAWYVKKLESQKEDMKREFPSTREESWQSSAEGNYYSRYIISARQEGRITKLFPDPTQPVHTAWDLGYNDSTAIWLFQMDGQRINVLEYYENSGEALPHYVQWLKSKSYSYGKHLVPHDASHHDYTSGLTRTEVAKNLGIRFTQVPNVPVVDGIDAVRNILHRCYFNEEKCALGVKMLDSYRKEWNEKHGCWRDKPLHNFASHGADAFRMLATGLKQLVSKGLTAEVGEVRGRYLY